MKIKDLFKMTYNKDQDHVLFLPCSEAIHVHLSGHSFLPILILNFYLPQLISMLATDWKEKAGCLVSFQRTLSPCPGPTWPFCFPGHCVVCLGKCALIKASVKLLLLTQYLYLQGSYCKDGKGWRLCLKMRLVIEGEGNKV